MSMVDMVTPAAASRTRPAGVREWSELRGDSCYFPGCRKDTNCHCEICLASISATRDLVPSSSTVSKISVSKPAAARRTNPVPFDPKSPASTLRVMSSSAPSVTPPATEDSSGECVTMREKAAGKCDRSFVLAPWLLFLLVGFTLLWAVDVCFSAAALRGLAPPKLTPEVVKAIGEEAVVLGNDLNGRLLILQRGLEAMIGEDVSNCGASDSLWELNQDGLFLFQWRCSMYKSMSEKVTIWGSPLTTTGLVTTRLSSRSMTLLSGKVVEWSNGRMLSTVRSSNSSSWSYGKWTLAALQLDRNTWVLEYERSSPFTGRVFAATLEMLRLRLSSMLLRLKAHNLQFLASDALFGTRLQLRPSRLRLPPT